MDNSENRYLEVIPIFFKKPTRQSRSASPMAQSCSASPDQQKAAMIQPQVNKWIPIMNPANQLREKAIAKHARGHSKKIILVNTLADSQNEDLLW